MQCVPAAKFASTTPPVNGRRGLNQLKIETKKWEQKLRSGEKPVIQATNIKPAPNKIGTRKRNAIFMKSSMTVSIILIAEPRQQLTRRIIQ